MKRILLTLFVLSWVGFLNGQTSVTVDSIESKPLEKQLPAYSNVYVNDYGNLLDAGTEARLTEYIKELKKEKGIELTVATIKKVSDYGSIGDLDYFATQLFNDWKIGNSSQNNGVLVLVSKGDRKMRIELGKGFPGSMDAKMKRAIDKTFIPYFKRNDYPKGIEEGTKDVIKQLTGHYPGEFNLTGTQKFFKSVKGFFGAIPKLLYLLLVIPFGFLFNRIWRRRPRNCTDCTNKMELLPEEREDKHLEGGQILEEYLKSVDYDVWVCTYCDHLEINRYQKWFSKASNCKSCGYRTLITTSTTLDHATRYSTGTKQLDYNCRHCGYTDTELRTIPMITSSTSSGGSSSSSSSFGGGSSSGGGASGSW